jgi:hypothetical protein
MLLDDCDQESSSPDNSSTSRGIVAHGRTRAVADNLKTTITTAEPWPAKAPASAPDKTVSTPDRKLSRPTALIASAICALPSRVGAAGIEPATSRV